MQLFLLPSLSVVLSLHDVPKTVLGVNQNEGAQAVIRGRNGMAPWSPVATALVWADLSALEKFCFCKNSLILGLLFIKIKIAFTMSHQREF